MSRRFELSIVLQIEIENENDAFLTVQDIAEEIEMMYPNVSANALEDVDEVFPEDD